MKIAVLTLTRDRLDYTKTCFQALRENAGCDYDHYVFDQGSTDGTRTWLKDRETSADFVLACDTNVGIHKAMNSLMDLAARKPYDLLVKVDNDCRVLTPGTLKAVAEHVLEDPRTARVVSPLILGLRHRPGIYDTREYRYVKRDDTSGHVRLGLTRALGGIFFPIPPLFIKEGLRYDESAPLWGGDDERIVAMAHERGGYSAYLLDFEAEHIDTTEGQVEKYPSYFARRVSEGGPAK